MAAAPTLPPQTIPTPAASAPQNRCVLTVTLFLGPYRVFARHLSGQHVQCPEGTLVEMFPTWLIVLYIMISAEYTSTFAGQRADGRIETPASKAIQPCKNF